MKPIIGLTMYDFDKKMDINNVYLTSIEQAGEFRFVFRMRRKEMLRLYWILLMVLY